MLLVTILNIDTTYHGVFDTDDKKTAAEAALADLVANNGFFPENRIVTDLPSSHQSPIPEYGVLLMPDEAKEDLEWHLSSENTYWIRISEYKLGTMIAS